MRAPLRTATISVFRLEFAGLTHERLCMASVMAEVLEVHERFGAGAARAAHRELRSLLHRARKNP